MRAVWWLRPRCGSVSQKRGGESWQGAPLQVWQSSQGCLLSSSLEGSLCCASGSCGMQAGALPGRRLGSSSVLLRFAASWQLGHQALHHFSPASRVHAGRAWQPVSVLNQPEDAAPQLLEVVLRAQDTSLTSAGWPQAFWPTTGRGCASQSILGNRVGLHRVAEGMMVQLLARRDSPQTMRCTAVCSWQPAGAFAASWSLPPTCCTSIVRARCEPLVRPQCISSSTSGRAGLHCVCQSCPLV